MVETNKNISKNSKFKSLKISWFIPRSFPDQHSYIFNTYSLISKINKDIRIDLADGGCYYGNKIPLKRQRKLFDVFLSKTKYKNTINYIWLKKNPIDILHLQYSWLFPYIIPLLNIENRPKIVITLRGSDTYYRPFIDKKWRDLYRIHSKNIDAFIVQSLDQKYYLERLGVKGEKIWIIPSSSESIECLPRKISKGDRIKIISAFRFVWEKNITGNLIFIKILKEKYPNIEYTIYGSGNDLGQIHYLIDRFDIGDVVEIKGHIPNEDLKQKYLEYDYYLQLSISESLSMTVIEAQQRGLIPIVSNIGGLKDLVQNGKTGIIQNFTDYKKLVDETITVHQNPELYNLLSRQCIENINKKFTTELEAQRLLEMYKTVNGNW